MSTSYSYISIMNKWNEKDLLTNNDHNETPKCILSAVARCLYSFSVGANGYRLP